jgi:hypothetical protein
MANRKLSKDEMIITSKHPEWLDTLVADRHCNDKLYKIILFFVIFSPCSKYCTQGRTLQFYNWKEKPWSTNRYLKSRLDDGVFTDRRNYFRCAEKISSLLEDFRKTDLGDNFYLHRAVERVAFTKVESSEYMSLFYHIRCALAHGRIAMFEDAATKDMCSTLCRLPIGAVPTPWSIGGRHGLICAIRSLRKRTWTAGSTTAAMSVKALTKFPPSMRV